MPEYLAELRKRGLSLRRFAKLVNLSPEWVSKVFRGEEEASAETERRIQEALCTCPWCGNDWPEKTKFDGTPSAKEERVVRR